VSDEPLERYESYEQMDKTIGDRVELTFVPMRNALFFVIAANRAACYGINTLITGICQADNANYPDCRESFRAAMENTINTALGRDDFVLRAPLLYNSKAQTVRLAYELPGCTTALAFSHTSYDGEYPPVDMNHANVLRAQGFLEANLPDPLVLRAALLDELMPLPETKNYFGVRNDPQFRDLLADIGYHANQWL
jgi:7-cyano-7-deazaguanine synthase